MHRFKQLSICIHEVFFKLDLLNDLRVGFLHLFFQNYHQAPPDVHTLLDGSTYPRWTNGGFSLLLIPTLQTFSGTIAATYKLK